MRCSTHRAPNVLALFKHHLKRKGPAKGADDPGEINREPGNKQLPRWNPDLGKAHQKVF